MPRTARQQSGTGVYHAILRGVNKQQIFECHEDYERFVLILQRQCGLSVELPSVMSRTNVELLAQLSDGDPEPEVFERHCYLYAWCLMGNHVHLLIKGCGEEVGDVMKRISSSYVYYYNHKYDRIGHLFQERFKSEPVEDWEYFLTLLRYIHQNPLKPHLVSDLRDYRWSSWSEYIGQSSTPFCSTEAVLKRISLDELKALVNQPLTEAQEESLLDYEPRVRKKQFTDAEVWSMIQAECSATNASEFQQLSRPYQKHVMYTIHESGVGPRQISRLTGITYSVVQKATNSINERTYYEQLHSEQMVRDSDPETEEYLTYLDPGSFQKYPEY